VQPLNVAPPSKATFISQPQHDQPSEPSIQIVVTKNNATDLPSSSTQALQPCDPINASSPPTLILNSIILTNVCESIFKELNKLVEARNNLVHEEDYVKEWRRLRERVDFVMSEFQKSCIDAHNNAKNSLHDWFKEVIKSMQEVEVKRSEERSKLYISNTPMFLDASGIISSSVQSENLDLKWLTKLKVQIDSPILEKLKSDSEVEKENKRLKKELLEYKLALAEHKRQT